MKLIILLVGCCWQQRLGPGEGMLGWQTYNYKNLRGGLDHATVHSGKSSYRMWADNPDGRYALAGAVTQRIRADRFRNQRIRFSTFLKLESAEGLTLHLEVLGRARSVAKIALSGTTDWKRYELVLDVPSDGVGIDFGFVLDKGTVWMDDAALTAVGREVPVTSHRDWPGFNADVDYNRLSRNSAIYRPEPVNLDFEEQAVTRK